MRIGLLCGFMLLMLGAYAQDTTRITRPQTILDSLNTLASKQWLTDSLSINAWGDSLKFRIEQSTTGKLSRLNQKMDSLKGLQLPTEQYKQKMDSILQKKTALLKEVQSKQQGLLNKTKGNIDEWQNQLHNDFGMDKLNLPATDLNLPTDFNIPTLGGNDFQLPDLSPELGNFNNELPFPSMDGLKEWQAKLGDLPDLKTIKNNPGGAIETAVGNIDGINELKDKAGMGALENSEFGKLAQSAQDPEALKQAAIEKAKEEAINHFSGKEQVLQAAMEQVAKYKQKFPSVGSLSEIQNLKRPPNPMKGKPFVERVLPGIAIQIHSKLYLNFDFNPYAGYRINGKLTAGLGWNQRFAMDWSTKNFVHDGRVYGPRTFVEFKLQRGFGIRMEAEWQNSFVPTYFIGSGDGKRQWVFSTMTGLKKDYRFFKKVKGFTMVQFDLVRLIKPNNNSPYGDVVNTRFGFEFPLKKKSKSDSAQSK